MSLRFSALIKFFWFFLYKYLRVKKWHMQIIFQHCFVTYVKLILYFFAMANITRRLVMVFFSIFFLNIIAINWYSENSTNQSKLIKIKFVLKIHFTKICQGFLIMRKLTATIQSVGCQISKIQFVLVASQSFEPFQSYRIWWVE